jgi:large subunit ribosomal protein L35
MNGKDRYLKRRMEVPKLKTHKGAKKRFSFTATGKVKRGHSHARHIMTKKTTKRKRKLDETALVSASETAKIRLMLPYA